MHHHCVDGTIHISLAWLAQTTLTNGKGIFSILHKPMVLREGGGGLTGQTSNSTMHARKETGVASCHLDFGRPPQTHIVLADQQLPSLAPKDPSNF
jgi:hypothetical protein